LAKTHSLSFRDLVREALGSGLQPWEFHEYTLEGLNNERKRELREDFQHTRILAYHMILPYLDKSAKKKSIDQIIPDIYDENRAKVISLKDQYERMKQRLARAGIKLEYKASGE
jgi:nitroreductase